MNTAALEEAVELAAGLGAADAEAVLMREEDLSVQVAGGEVEGLSLAEGIGLGVRLFTADRRMGFAYSSDLAAGPRKTVENAWENALANDPDPHNVLLEGSETSSDDWSRQDFQRIPVSDKVDFARALEQKTLDADSRIAQVRRATYNDGSYEIALANSNGLHRSFRNSSCSCSVMARAEAGNGDAEQGSEFDFARTFDALRPDWVASRCAQKATEALGGRPCATGTMPVVFDNFVAFQLLTLLVAAMQANNVLKGKSFLAGHVGGKVSAACLSIVDQNDLPEGVHPSPFDGEGASAQRTVFLEEGTLQGFLHNAYTAHKMGTATTANASRGFSSTPEVSASNLYLAPGSFSQQRLIEHANHGLLVKGAMGMHTADPISGDFSFGASGLLLENGRPSRAVRGVTLAGNIKDLLMNVDAVADDLRFFSSCGAPSVLVSELMVSGE